MMPSTAQVDEIVRSVLDITLRLDANELRRSPELNPQPQMVRAQVNFNGEWKGQVFMYVSPDLAREIAAVMMCSAPEDMGREEAFDAVGELTNMIAGNLRPLLRGSRSLSLPKVTEQGLSVAPVEGNPVELSYRLDGRRLCVAVAGSSTNSLN
jgi:hypothetical protein